MDNKLYWNTFEYKKKEKTADWYWAVILITLSVIVISIILKNFLFAILIFVAVGSLLMFSIRDPKIVKVELNNKGIKLDKDLYPYTSLESFWVDAVEDKEAKIILKSTKKIMPFIIVPIEEYHHEDIRNFLLNNLTEKEDHEPVSHKIMEHLGF